jgi:hypothetical protein
MSHGDNHRTTNYYRRRNQQKVSVLFEIGIDARTNVPFAGPRINERAACELKPSTVSCRPSAAGTSDQTHILINWAGVFLLIIHEGARRSGKMPRILGI